MSEITTDMFAWTEMYPVTWLVYFQVPVQLPRFTTWFTLISHQILQASRLLSRGKDGESVLEAMLTKRLRPVCEVTRQPLRPPLLCHHPSTPFSSTFSEKYLHEFQVTSNLRFWLSIHSPVRLTLGCSGIKSTIESLSKGSQMIHTQC